MSAKDIYALDIEPRETLGKGHSRRLRRLQDKVPGILYGSGEPAQPIMLDHKKLMHALEHDAFYSKLLTLNMGKNKQQVVLKALHRHPFKKAVMHVDFLRVKPTDILQMRIPIHFLNKDAAPGLKEGGVMTHHMMDVEIKCQASALPESIELDIGNMVLDQTIHLSQLNLPKGVEIVALLSHGKEADHPVISLQIPKVVEEVEATVVVPEEGAEGASAAAAVPVEPKGTAKAADKDKKDKGK